MQSKGATYSKFFRKAGLAWGRGDLHQAIAILEEGLALATDRGDEQMAQVLQEDLARYRQMAAAEGVDLPC